MAEALKVNNEELQSSGSGRGPEAPRQTPEWIQRIAEYPRR